MPRRSLPLSVVVAALVLLSGAGTSAQDARRPAGKEVPAAEREATALEFAREHHRELAELVEKLKDGDRKAYDKAVQELYRASERLTRIQDRTPRLYAAELKAWKIDSRIRLLQARMTMAEDTQLEDQLRQALTERAELRIERLKAERTQLQDALRKVDERLAEAEKARDVEAQLKMIKQKMAKNRPGQKRPAVTRPNKPSSNTNPSTLKQSQPKPD